MPNLLSPPEAEAVLTLLRDRFTLHPERHAGIAWAAVQDRLEANPDKLRTLHEMERTGGEPDVVGVEADSGALRFVDCSPQSPAGRRSLCFDAEALASRRKHKPAGSALDMARAMGVDLLSEEDYRALQALGPFDTTTSSWIQTPPRIRTLGGALFCDRRYETVFVYHNGAESYYAARGFRALLRV